MALPHPRLWCRRHWCLRHGRLVALVVLLSPLPAPGWAAEPAAGMPAVDPAPPAQIARDGWKDCAFDDVVIRCIDEQLPDGLRIVWVDGLRMTYRERPGSATTGAGADAPVVLVDRLGGLWQREVLVQGNTVLTHLGRSAHRIVVPLRFPCKPPLRGEVGYCRR